MKTFSFIITSLFLLSCQQESKFELNKDLYRFSEKMENGDTVKIITDLSACTFFAFEEYTFIKQNDTLFLEKYAESMGGKQTQKSPRIIYNIRTDNSKSFEHLLKYLKQTDTLAEQKNNWPFVSITYKNQQKKFYTDGLRDRFEKIDSLMIFRENLYPRDSFFHVPPPPLK